MNDMHPYRSGQMHQLRLEEATSYQTHGASSIAGAQKCQTTDITKKKMVLEAGGMINTTCNPNAPVTGG